MASFINRGTKQSPSWQYTISRMVNGKSKPIRKSGFKTKKEAQIAAAEIEEKLNKGIKVVTKLIPFEDYFAQWTDLYKSNVRKGTTITYRNTLRIIKEYLPGTPIQHITKNDYQLFINNFGKDKARETIKKLNSHIRACVKDAIDDGIIHMDFTRNVVISGSSGKRVEEKYLNYGESQQLLNNLHENLSPDRLTYYIILLALTTGMRFAEIIGLTRSDFDFVNDTITINKTWGYSPNAELGVRQTKTDKSNRVVKVDSRTMMIFKDLFQQVPDNIHRLVFYQPTSKYKVYSNTGVNKALRKILGDLNIDYVSIHGMRHTHASVLLYKGVSIQYISERLGHTDIDTTLKKYAHMIKELRKQDEEKAISVFNAM